MGEAGAAAGSVPRRGARAATGGAWRRLARCRRRWRCAGWRQAVPRARWPTVGRCQTLPRADRGGGCSRPAPAAGARPPGPARAGGLCGRLARGPGRPGEHGRRRARRGATGDPGRAVRRPGRVRQVARPPASRAPVLEPAAQVLHGHVPASARSGRRGFGAIARVRRRPKALADGPAAATCAGVASPGHHRGGDVGGWRRRRPLAGQQLVQHDAQRVERRCASMAAFELLGGAR